MHAANYIIAFVPTRFEEDHAFHLQLAKAHSPKQICFTARTRILISVLRQAWKQLCNLSCAIT